MARRQENRRERRGATEMGQRERGRTGEKVRPQTEALPPLLSSAEADRPGDRRRARRPRCLENSATVAAAERSAGERRGEGELAALSFSPSLQGRIAGMTVLQHMPPPPVPPLNAEEREETFRTE